MLNNAKEIDSKTMPRRRAKVKDLVKTCPYCKSKFNILPSIYRARRARSKSGDACCSVACGIRHSHALFPNPAHGMLIRYRQGCRCPKCKAVKQIESSRYKASKLAKQQTCELEVES